MIADFKNELSQEYPAPEWQQGLTTKRQNPGVLSYTGMTEVQERGRLQRLQTSLNCPRSALDQL